MQVTYAQWKAKNEKKEESLKGHHKPCNTS